MESSGYSYEISNIRISVLPSPDLRLKRVSLGVIRTKSRLHAPNPDGALDRVTRFF